MLTRVIFASCDGFKRVLFANLYCAATEAIEDSFGDAAASDPVVPLGYRLSALISADVHAVQSMGQIPSVAEDLLHFWRRVDPNFLRIQ